MAEFKDRLEEALKLRDMKPAELARVSGVTEGAISQYRKGAYNATQRNLEKIARVLRVPIPWLMGATDSMTFEIPEGFQPMPQMDNVPLVGEIACGTPILAEQNVEDTVSIPSEWHASFTLKCKGDSMAPTIQDGDLVAIRIQPEVENGEIAAVRIENEATLKRVYLHDDYIELRPDNMSHPSIIRRKDEMNDVHIEGKAVGLCRGLQS